jgi:ankyrin repeat protein
MMACMLGQENNVNVLLNSPLVNINETDNRGKTALYYACKFLHFEIVKNLIENGANYNSCYNNDGYFTKGNRILHYLIWDNRYLEIIEYLLETCDINANEIILLDKKISIFNHTLINIIIRY